MRLLDWLLGRGRNPLEVPEEERAESFASAPATTPGDPASDDMAVIQQTSTLGVTPEVMHRMLIERKAFVAELAADPRAWGFDLLPASAERRDAAAEFRRRTRMTGALGDSVLVAFDPLLAVVPDPPTMPDGTPLDVHLQRHARLEAEPAQEIAQHVRTTIQATLGRPLDEDAFERAVREAAWDHELDAAQVTPLVLRAVGELL